VRLRWTEQAVADLAAIHVFIEQGSPHYAYEIQILTIHHAARQMPHSRCNDDKCGRLDKYLQLS